MNVFKPLKGVPDGKNPDCLDYQQLYSIIGILFKFGKENVIIEVIIVILIYVDMRIIFHLDFFHSKEQVLFVASSSCLSSRVTSPPAIRIIHVCNQTTDSISP